MATTVEVKVKDLCDELYQLSSKKSNTPRGEQIWNDFLLHVKQNQDEIKKKAQKGETSSKVLHINSDDAITFGKWMQQQTEGVSNVTYKPHHFRNGGWLYLHWDKQ